MKATKAPEILQIPVAELDTSQLPAGARQPGTKAFEQAVLTHFALKYAERGWNAAVTVDDEYIRVVAVPQEGVAPKDYVVGLLQHGFLEEALPMLEALDGMLDDADVAYNHGICLSELGRTEESVTPLRRCLELDPGYTNAAVGLGVAFARLHRDDEAAEALRTALTQDPGNVFALGNLAAVRGRQGKLTEALPSSARRSPPRRERPRSATRSPSAWNSSAASTAPRRSRSTSRSSRTIPGIRWPTRRSRAPTAWRATTSTGSWRASRAWTR